MEKETYIEMNNNEDRHWWFVARRRIVKKVLDYFLKQKANREVLEVGCGSGGNLEMLSYYGKLSAFEIDDQARCMANSRNITLVKKGELPKGIPFNGDFDLICLLDVLEHIDDDVGSIKALSASLKPDGKILITVPAYKFLWSNHDIVNHHKRRYLLRHLLKIIKASGLNVVYSTYFNTLLFPVIFITRIINNIVSTKVGSDVNKSPTMVNSILLSIFSSERLLIPRFFWPFGVSILVLAEKPVTTKGE